MRIPQMEDGLYPEQREALAPWSVEARRVLPSRSPRIDSTAVWAPALGWALLHVLAEWIETRELSQRAAARESRSTIASRAGQRSANRCDAPSAPIERPAKPSPAAIDKRAIALYDQLRLRTAFGESFAIHRRRGRRRLARLRPHSRRIAARRTRKPQRQAR